MALLVDTHCHLDDERFTGEEDAVLERAKQASVEWMVTIGTDEKTSAAAAAVA
ncbi:MAG: TatD family hydrolase, partial [bacterium]